MLLVCSLVGTGYAQAQPDASAPADEARRAEARRHFDRGLLLAETGKNWSAALAEFLASRQLYPTRSATRNGAIALRQLDRHVEAYDLYTTLLKEFAASMSPDQIAAIGAEMNATQLNISELELRCSEAGALVTVDGTSHGETPLSSPIRLNAGAHTARIVKSGFEPFELWLELEGGVRKAVDARLRALVATGLLVVPTPSNATVRVDGVAVGSGVWRGRLPNGLHLIEVTALGYEPFRREVRTDGGEPLVLRAVLERDLSSPLWRPRFRPSFYLEATVGPLLARSLGGGADDACNCSDRSRPLGLLAAARGGYEPARGLGLELTAGALWLWESMTRRLELPGEFGPLSSETYHDRTKLSGPFGALGASYRLLEKTPLTARASVGLAFLTSRTSNSGTFAGTALDASDAPQPFESHASIPELERRLLTPFLSAELRAGYRFSERISADLGVSLMLFLPSRVARAGATSFSTDHTRESPFIDSSVTGAELKPGVLRLPNEEVAGAFLALLPALGARVAF